MWFDSVLILPAAFGLDILLGDPRWLPHPIRWMGWAIQEFEPVFRKLRLSRVVSGGLFALLLIAAAFGTAYLLCRVAGLIHPAARWLVEVVLIYFCIASKSLAESATKVALRLMRDGVPAARREVAMIVGRDTRQLSGPGIVRGAVETVAENTVDGITAPLLFAAIGGAPLAVAYKMFNTLDSMVGYKNDTYAEFGKVSARIDDIANFIPARLTVPVIALAAQILNGTGRRSLATAGAEGAHHSSPNAGHPEAAFAGALGVKLNGPNYYHGKLVDKPYIGLDFKAPVIMDVFRAADLMLLTSLMWVALGALVHLFLY